MAERAWHLPWYLLCLLRYCYGNHLKDPFFDYIIFDIAFPPLAWTVCPTAVCMPWSKAIWELTVQSAFSWYAVPAHTFRHTAIKQVQPLTLRGCLGTSNEIVQQHHCSLRIVVQQQAVMTGLQSLCIPRQWLSCRNSCPGVGLSSSHMNKHCAAILQETPWYKLAKFAHNWIYTSCRKVLCFISINTVVQRISQIPQLDCRDLTFEQLQQIGFSLLSKARKGLLQANVMQDLVMHILNGALTQPWLKLVSK